MACRYLSANQSPDFHTIADFRRRHLKTLEELFVQILRLCREAGLVTMGRVALDGRKVGATSPGSLTRILIQADQSIRGEE